LGLAWVHLAALWAFAVAQPLFDVLADSPDFFVARGNTRGDILMLAFGVILLPPTILLALELPFVRWARFRWFVHVVLVGGLCTTLALQVVEGALSDSTAVLFLVSAALGIAAAITYARQAAVRSVLTVLGPAPLVVLVLFLVVSPVSKLIFPNDDSVAAGADVNGTTPVIVVVFDEFAGTALLNSDLEIDAARYPNFAELAREATFYRNATTASASTTYAVPGIASGRVPGEGDLPNTTDYPVNLFTLLGKDYRMNVNEPATELCPERLCGERDRGTARQRLKGLFDDLTVVSAHLLLPPALDKKLPAVDRTFGGFRTVGDATAAGKTADPDAGIPRAASNDRHGQWRRTVDDVTPVSPRPSLTFVHVLLPHFPWTYLPTGQQYSTPNGNIPGVAGEAWSSQREIAEQGYQRFLLQAAYTDKLIGDLIAELKATGVWDRVMLVVTADHGVSFHAGKPRRSITSGTLGDIAPVPLFVKYPGRRQGRVDDRMARNIDILPTIADQLGIPLQVDGASLLKPPKSPPPPVSVEEGGSNPVRVPFDEYLRERDAAVQRKTRLFGEGHRVTDLFEPRASRDLAGRSARSLVETSRPATATIALDSPQLFEKVNPDGRFVPAFVTGLLQGAAPGQRFAIAVNGRIRATSTSYEDADGVRLGGLIDPAVLRSGENEIAVYAVQGSGEPRLRPVKRTDTVVEARLVERDGQTSILGSLGTVRVQEGQMRGFIESKIAEAGSIKISGWAFDTARNAPVAKILVFADDRLVAAGAPTLNRPDIADKFGPEVARAGFTISGQGSEDADLRIFAVSDDRASEISAD
jgi:hypothetical protein